MIAKRREQIVEHGHTAAADADRQPWQFAMAMVGDLVDVQARLEAPRAAGNLTTAKRRLVKNIAMGLALLDRIDAEAEKYAAEDRAADKQDWGEIE